MKIRYLGHASFQIETKGSVLLVDPFISANPLANHISVGSLKADFILVTHGHEDHVADVEGIAKRTGAKIISNYEVASWFGNKGLKWHPMNHGGTGEFAFGTLKYVTAVHSSTLPDGSSGGDPGGFVLWNDEGCVYLAGDTAVTLDMQLIPRLCPPLDIAVLPIGDNFTMGYQDAVVAADFIKCDRIIGCHFNTFEIISINENDAIQAFAKADKELMIMNIGDSIDV